MTRNVRTEFLLWCLAPRFVMLLMASALLCATAVAQALSPTPTGSAPASTFGGPGAVTQSVGANSTQNPFFGGTPSGQVTMEVIGLSLQDAIARGLKYNLGLILTEQSTVAAQGSFLRTRSDLLPNITTRIGESLQQINLAAFGFPPTPGVKLVRGPFGVFDARAGVTQSLLDLKALNNTRASSENVRATKLSYQDARDLVVLVVGGSYIQALAGAARIEAVQAQVNTAQSLFQQALDLKRAGVIAGIDVLRAQVELQVQQQRLVAVKNDFEKQKLAIARAIGLPVAQQFKLTDQIPYAPAPPVSFEQALDRAYKNRADYKSALALLNSARFTRKAAVGERLPSIQVNGEYGIVGQNVGNSHGTFLATASLKIPIFQGGKVRGDIIQADALIRQREAEASDLRSNIEFQLRTAFLDLKSAADQVDVAKSSVNLAEEQVRQAKDRFSAGVTNNIEVVQAQEALATTNENYISSLFAHNFAKLSLARALGVAEEATKEFLRGSQ